MSYKKDYDVIVIGAGPSGIKSALKCSKKGLKVLIIDSNGNSGGQIYNAISETQSEKNSSPIGTEWAIGDTSNIESLTFAPFRSAVGSPQSVVGKKLVLHIIEEDVYMSVEFTSWASGQAGGFAYIRSSEN